MSETGDRQQSTQPQGNKHQRSKPRHTLWRRLPRGKHNHQAARHRRNRRGRKGAEQRQPEGIEQGQPGEEPPWPRRDAKAAEPLEKPTDQPWREGRNSLPAEKRSPEDTATDRKGEPRGDQKPKRRKALRAAPPRTDRRDGEEKENGLDHNKEKTDKQKGDSGAPPKGNEDPTY